MGTTAIVDVLGMTYKVREQTAISFVIKINNTFSIELAIFRQLSFYFCQTFDFLLGDLKNGLIEFDRKPNEIRSVALSAVFTLQSVEK